MQPGERGRKPLVVAGKSPETSQPSEGAFDDPAGNDALPRLVAHIGWTHFAAHPLSLPHSKVHDRLQVVLCLGLVALTSSADAVEKFLVKPMISGKEQDHGAR